MELKLKGRSNVWLKILEQVSNEGSDFEQE